MSAEDIVFIDTYLCPHCRSELEAGPEFWQGWLRCPACSRPSLPPSPVTLPHLRRAQVRTSRPPDLLFISESGSRTITADTEDNEPELPLPTRFSPARLVLTTGLALSLFMGLVAYLDSNTVNMAIFGFLSLIFFVMLLRNRTRRRSAT
jgi:hypothetical protein